jgi:hypothetical protein
MIMINRARPVIMPATSVGHDGGHGDPTRIHQDLCRAAVACPRPSRWPQAGELEFRYRGAFVYVQAHLPDGTVQPLIRLRYGGSARHWGFGLYLASNDHYQNQTLPSGSPNGSPEEALDTACHLYLDNPSDHPNHPRRTSESDH